MGFCDKSMSLVEEKRDRLSSQIGDGITLKDYAGECVARGGGGHGRPTAGFEILRDPWVLSRMHVRLDVSQSTDAVFIQDFVSKQLASQIGKQVAHRGKEEGERGNGQ
jgi:hypothetical protein